MLGDVGNKIAVDIDCATVLEDLTCSAPVLQVVMGSSDQPQWQCSPGSRQAVDALDLARLRSADAMVGAAAVGKRADQGDFIWQGRVG